jgi:glutathione synthase/RimK-type ligase-like ATP-grasp enzyme
MTAPKIKAVVFVDVGVSRTETPQRLAARLEPILKANDIEFYNNPSTKPDGDYLVIRWGATRMSHLDSEAKEILNPAERIAHNANDKRAAHKAMLDAGVSTPKFWTTWEAAKAAGKELGCDLLRRRLHHTRGKDIIRVKPTDNLPRRRRSGYYVQLLDKDAEFRLHMFGSDCIGMAQKLNTSGQGDPLIWNDDHGWEFKYIPQDEREQVPYYNEMVAESAKALKAIGLNFGAVDLIMVKGQPYILEVNTAPALHQTKRYSKAMIKWIQRIVGHELDIPSTPEPEGEALQ